MSLALCNDENANGTSVEPKRVDNYLETALAVRDYIVQKAPLGLLERHKQLLIEITGAEIDMSAYELDFRRFSLEQNRDHSPACQATLCVFYKNVSGEGPVEDNEGNLWCKYKVEAKVTWPSWAPAKTYLALERLDLMNEICEFAALIETVFSAPVWSLVETKEQREESSKKFVNLSVQERIRGIIELNRKSMRIGTERRWEAPDGAHGLILGDYTIVVDERNGTIKQYAVSVTATHWFSFTRIL